MSVHIEWLSARFMDVTGSASPGSFVNDGSENGAAAIRLTSESGDGVIIEGRPEDLLGKAREILRCAELIVEQTMRDPQLRSLYGMTSVEHPSQVGTPSDAGICAERGQHVRSTRHTRWECPSVTEMDVDA